MLRLALVAVSLIFALAACGGEGPVAENAVAPSDAHLEIAADGLAAPANSALAETIDRAAAPLPADGLAWMWRADQRSAVYGPPEARAMLSIACDLPARRLVITRTAAGPDAAMATLSLTGNGHVASLPLSKRAGQAAADIIWRGAATSDDARAIQRLFDGPGPVETSLGDTSNLVLPPSAVPRRALAACR